jgi:hypothetical protein
VGDYLGGLPEYPYAIKGPLLASDAGVRVKGRSQERTMLGTARKAEVFVAWSDVASVTVNTHERGKSRVGEVLAFGVIGLGAKASEIVSEMVVRMKNGDVAYFATEQHGAQLLSKLKPILDQVGIFVRVECGGFPSMPGAPTTADAADRSVASELERLIALRDRGELSAQEFELLKARLLKND